MSVQADYQKHIYKVSSIALEIHLYIIFRSSNVFLSKVGDGNPLRRWRVCVEVSAAPAEVLHRLLRERPLWETELQQEKILETLDKQTDVYLYSCCNMPPQPTCEYVVLR